MTQRLLALFTLFLFHMAHAQEVLPLYDDNSIPNSKPSKDQEFREAEKDTNRVIVSRVSRPKLLVFLPPAGKANGTAVIICPGGSYLRLAVKHEGTDVARKLNEWGITAFVLQYRLPDDSIMIDKRIGSLQDAQRAIQLVRQKAATWGIRPDRIGIMGFSAGGHLASTAGTHFSTPVIDNPGGTSLRPDFMVLLYPVISFADSIGHLGSRKNLLGPAPSAADILKYSNEQQVTPQTPPTFLVHAEDDHTVKVVNTLYFYEALQRNGVPAELHVYPKGGHGFGMKNPSTRDEWMDQLKNWLDAQGLLSLLQAK